MSVVYSVEIMTSPEGNTDYHQLIRSSDNYKLETNLYLKMLLLTESPCPQIKAFGGKGYIVIKKTQ